MYGYNNLLQLALVFEHGRAFHQYDFDDILSTYFRTSLAVVCYAVISNLRMRGIGTLSSL